MALMDAPLVILDNLYEMIDGEEAPPHGTILTHEVYQWAHSLPVAAEVRLARLLEGQWHDE